MTADPLSATNPRRKTPLQRQTAIQTAVIRNLQRGWPMSVGLLTVLSWWWPRWPRSRTRGLSLSSLDVGVSARPGWQPAM